ncbi:MAG: ParB N-terminal domain-containing protein [Thermodesulfobacteriota bacterium]
MKHKRSSIQISSFGKTNETSCKEIKKIVWINLEELKEHEEIRPEYLESLKNEILSDGILKMPICIDQKTFIILDGHHRLHALKRLGCRRIPCVLVDYQSPEIVVIPWREGERITKEEIIEVALQGRKMPPKTSKHMIRVGGEWKHISVIEETINVPLKELK